MAAALVCEQAGHEVTVFDPFGFEDLKQGDEISSRVWVLGPSAKELVAKIGAWKPNERVCTYRSMRVLDSRSDAKVSFSDPQLGHVVEADWIRRCLLQQVAQTEINCLVQRVREVSKNGSLQCDDGQQMNAQLVIFAEGRQAQTACLSGFEKIDGGYQQCAMVGTLKCSKSHDLEAFQIFTDVGPLALLPLPQRLTESRVSVVWSLPVDLADQWKDWTPVQLAKHIAITSERARGALEFVDVPVWIPFSQHSLKQDALGCRLAIGDTAHGILPLAGLGANLGFGDVIALNNTLRNYPRFDAEQIARTVARERRFEQRVIAKMMGVFSDAFRSNEPVLQLARSLAFRTADRHPIIRRLVQEFVG